MNVVEINRTSNNHDDYYGVIKLSYDEIVMIANALHKYHKNAEQESVKQMSYMLRNKWSNFRDMTCYGEIHRYLEDEE